MKLETILAASALVLPLVAGCAAGPGEDRDDFTSHAGQALTFETREADHIAGRYEHGGAAIRFDFKSHGNDKEVVVSTDTGTPLVESTIHQGGNHTTRVLGGRLVVEDTGAAPQYTGDRHAEQDLHAMPEAEAMGGLETALAAEGVPGSLLPTERLAAGGSHTESVGYGHCGAWISQGGWATCGTTFFGWTNLHVSTNCSSNSVNYVFDGNPGWTDPWCASYDKGGWYWGRDINFFNALAYCNTATCFHPVLGVPVYFGH